MGLNPSCGGTRLQCDDPTDCASLGAGSVCCMPLNPAGNATLSECMSLADCQAKTASGGPLILCDPATASGGTCPTGACSATGKIPGHSACQ